MFNSRFQLREIARYLNRHLRRRSVASAFTYRKNELHIPFSSGPASAGLHLSFQPPLPFLKILAKAPAPREKVVLFKSIHGCPLGKILWHRTDRQLLIELEGAGYLLLQLFGINGNVYLLDRDFRIQEAFKKSKAPHLPRYEHFTDHPETEPPTLKNEDLLQQYPDKTMAQLLRRLPLPVHSKTLQQEIAYRSGTDIKSLVINLSPEQLQQFLDEYIRILKALATPQYLLYDENPPILTLLPLTHLKSAQPREFPDIAACTRTYIATYFRRRNFNRLQQTLILQLEKIVQRLQRKRERQRRSLQKIPSADDYHRWGDALLANLHQIPTSAASVTLPDPEKEDGNISIPLNPAISPAENANRYYHKSRDIEKSKKELQSSLDNIESELAQIRELREQVQNCRSTPELQRLAKKVDRLLPPQISPGADTERRPYYQFRIDDWTVLVGKKARDNDRLTFKNARPEDFWLHSEYTPGSHVIIRNPGKAAAPPEPVLLKAAGLAAFYSKARHSGLVPVIYTKRKYVWKRKRMPPGKVFSKFTKSVIVKPLDPKTLSKS